MTPVLLNDYRSVLTDDFLGIRGLEYFLLHPANSGNSVFLEAIQRQTGATVLEGGQIASQKEYIEQNHSAVILAMANMISDTWRAGDWFIEAIENYKIPVILVSIGLGVGSVDSIHTLQMSDHTKRLLDVAKKWNTIIGARGYYTLEYLKSQGYDNVMAIGCPSLYSTTSLSLRSLPSAPKIVTHTTPYFHLKEETKRLFRFGIKYADGYMIQSEERFLLSRFGVDENLVMSWFDQGRGVQAQRAAYSHNLYEIFAPDGVTPEDFERWMVRVGMFFTELTPWVGALTSFDVSVGGRFHGTVAALLSGSPAFLYTIDVRTRELAEFHSIPHSPISELPDNLSLDEISDQFDYSSMEKQHLEHIHAYIQYLTANRLQYLETV